MYSKIKPATIQKALESSRPATWTLLHPSDEKWERTVRLYLNKTERERLGEIATLTLDPRIIDANKAKAFEKVLSDLSKIEEIFGHKVMCALHQFAMENLVIGKNRFTDVPSLIYYFMNNHLGLPEDESPMKKPEGSVERTSYEL